MVLASVLSTRVAATLPRLRPAETRAALTMRDLGTALATMTCVRVADAAGVNASTVVRTCHLLGFQSFGEARAAALRETAS